MRFLPLGLDLRDTRCVIVGGGTIGTRKAGTLVRAGARVVVVAPRISLDLAAQHEAGQVEWLAVPFREEHLDGAMLVVAATDNRAVNESVTRAARRRGSLICDATSVARSQVIFGALHESTDVTIAIFTDGRSPARARHARDQICSTFKE